MRSGEPAKRPCLCIRRFTQIYISTWQCVCVRDVHHHMTVCLVSGVSLDLFLQMLLLRGWFTEVCVASHEATCILDESRDLFFSTCICN